MATITIRDSTGASQAVNVPNDDGRAAASASRSVALCNEDAAKVPALGQAAMAASIPVVIANNQSRTPVGVLLAAGTARQLAAGASSANTALTAGIRAISIFARGGDIRFAIGNTSQTASGTSHYIASGERLDFDVSGLSTPNIGVIRVSADCTLEVSELS